MLVVTADLVRASYGMLLQTREIGAWNLPDQEDVRFSVIKTNGWYADYEFKAGMHHIRASDGMIGALDTLNRSIAHECIHMHGKLLGLRRYGSHGKWFRDLAVRVCDELGFDAKAF